MQTHSSDVLTFNDILFSFWLLSTVLRMRISTSEVPQLLTYSKIKCLQMQMPEKVKHSAFMLAHDKPIPVTFILES